MALHDLSVDELLTALGDKTPTPGGGAVAPLVAGLATALGRMVLAYSVDKPSLSEHRDGNEDAMRRLHDLQQQAMQCAEDDAIAYAALNALMKLSKDDPQRAAEWTQAVEGAMDPPRRTLQLCGTLIDTIDGLAATTNRWLASDLAVAAVLLVAAARAAAWNVRANLTQLDDAARVDALRSEIEAQIDAVHARADDLERRLAS
tara:strand:+ start:408 stop:1016 length:609 start_codon:yes stop_codon:yes gene_type:complete